MRYYGNPFGVPPRIYIVIPLGISSKIFREIPLNESLEKFPVDSK